jgi:hypothetical protein
MIQCDDCGEWAATECLEMKEWKKKLDDMHYFCAECIEMHCNVPEGVEVHSDNAYLLVEKNKEK